MDIRSQVHRSDSVLKEIIISASIYADSYHSRIRIIVINPYLKLNVSLDLLHKNVKIYDYLYLPLYALYKNYNITKYMH
jgi:hypothetical protein